MASYNRVILLGNLTRDIELRYTNSRMAVCQNAIAVNDRRKNASGEWIDETSFVDVTFFGRTAEVVSEYLSKGSPIFVEGRLKQDTWEKEGQKRSKLHVIVDRMQLLGGRSEGKNGEARHKRKQGIHDLWIPHTMGLVLCILEATPRCTSPRSGTMSTSMKTCPFNE